MRNRTSSLRSRDAGANKFVPLIKNKHVCTWKITRTFNYKHNLCPNAAVPLNGMYLNIPSTERRTLFGPQGAQARPGRPLLMRGRSLLALSSRYLYISLARCQVIDRTKWDFFILWLILSKIYMVFSFHDDVMTLDHFQHYWSFVIGIHRPARESIHKGPVMRSLMCTTLFTWQKISPKQSSYGDSSSCGESSWYTWDVKVID